MSVLAWVALATTILAVIWIGLARARARASRQHLVVLDEAAAAANCRPLATSVDVTGRGDGFSPK